jgi:hypothetical protein
VRRPSPEISYWRVEVDAQVPSVYVMSGPRAVLGEDPLGRLGLLRDEPEHGEGGWSDLAREPGRACRDEDCDEGGQAGEPERK